MKEMMENFGLSQRRFCRSTQWKRSTLQYRVQAKDESQVVRRLEELAAQHPRWGCPTLHELLRRENLVINHKRTGRLYRQLGLSLRRKARKKLPATARESLTRAQAAN